MTNRILIFGATGRTGRRAMGAASKRGVPLAVFVRDPSKLDAVESFEVHVGDVRRAEDVAGAIRKGDVVISALGTSRAEGMTKTRSDGTRAIVRAMRACGASRVVGLVGAGVLQWDATMKRNEHPSYPAMFRAVGLEHQAVVDVLAASGLSWLVVCTPDIVDAEATGRLVTRVDYLPDGIGQVTTGDVGELLVSEALAPSFDGVRLGVNQRDVANQG